MIGVCPVPLASAGCHVGPWPPTATPYASRPKTTRARVGEVRVMARMLARGQKEHLTALGARLAACIETSAIAAANESARRDGGTRSRDGERDPVREKTRSAGRADPVRESAVVDRHVNQDGRGSVMPRAPRAHRADWTLSDPPAGCDSPMDVWTEKLSGSDRALRRHETSSCLGPRRPV